MKRVLLLAGVAIGVITGSKLGRQPYEKVQSALRNLGARPEVQKVKNAVAGAASDLSETTAERIDDAKDKVGAKLSA